MSRARFQLFIVDRTDVGWRCVASNNRELARSPEQYLDAHEARGAVSALLAAGPDLVVSVLLDAQGRWRWMAELDGDVVAVSSRWYYRRVECEAAMTQFQAAAGSAAVADQVARFTAGAPVPSPRARQSSGVLVPSARRPLTERRGPVLQPFSRYAGGASHKTA